MKINNKTVIATLEKLLKKEKQPGKDNLLKFRVMSKDSGGVSLGYALDMGKPREGENIATYKAKGAFIDAREGDFVLLKADSVQPEKNGDSWGINLLNPKIIKKLGPTNHHGQDRKPDCVKDILVKSLTNGNLKCSESDFAQLQESGMVKFNGNNNNLKFDIPLIKDKDKQLVYGVVYEPFDPANPKADLQGDYATAEEIQKTAHLFLEEYNSLKLMHAQNINSRAKVVESYIAPVTFEVGGETIVKGSWVMVTHVIDKNMWQAVLRGDIDAYSIEGSSQAGPDLF